MSEKPRHLLIALIAYDGKPEWDTSLSVHAAAASLAQQGIQSSIVCAKHLADLCAARNGLFSLFMDEPSCTDMLCVDSDVSWPPGTVERIMSHPVDLVFGAYPFKSDENPGFPVSGFPGQDTHVVCVNPLTGEPQIGGLVEVDAGPGGFLRITKNCASRMVEAYEDRWYNDRTAPTGRSWSLFEFTFSQEEHRRWGEDLEFMRKWRRIGGKVWLDPCLTFAHHGKKTWRGCIGQQWSDTQKRASHLQAAE